MRVGILGTGEVGRSLGKGLIALGMDARMGSRKKGGEVALSWVRECGDHASEGTFSDAASYGEILFLATLGSANETVIRLAGEANFSGKVLVDVTNPLDGSTGFPPRLAICGEDSSGEQVQRLVPMARVVKAFNTVGNSHFFRPTFPGGPPDMFICGNDVDAKNTVSNIVREFGWGVVDAGDIRSSRYLEGLCMLWLLYGAQSGSWNHAFKLLRK
jgi:8-hydroxy-5-deazaflavin:NADPH oxidoreductase